MKYLTKWYEDNKGLYEDDSFKITLAFIKKDGGLLKQVTDRFYSNGEFVPKCGIAVNIRNKLLNQKRTMQRSPYYVQQLRSEA